MISQFAVRLICGMSLTWCLMPREKVTAGFFRIQTLVTLGLAVLAAATLGQRGDLSDGRTGLAHAAALALAVGIAVCSYVASVLWMLARRKEGTAALCGIALSATALLIGTTPLLPGWSGLLAVLSELSSAWLLGAVTTAMLLGHWHLTATSMSLDPLKRLTLLFGAAAATRTVLAGIGLLTLRQTALGDVERIWLLLRWSAGCVGPLLICAMTWRILRYRNTQSATGVLFAGVILTFIGETTAALLMEELDRPL